MPIHHLPFGHAEIPEFGGAGDAREPEVDERPTPRGLRVRSTRSIAAATRLGRPLGQPA
jgi:hypothetical protein